MGVLAALFGRSKKKRRTEFMTLRGEKVKSWSEKTIADYLFRNGIRYEYEREAKVTRLLILSRRISRPDFYLNDYGFFVEFWGLAAAEDRKLRKSYEKGMRWKMAMYRKHRIKFISLYPQDLRQLDSVFRKKLDEALERACRQIDPQSRENHCQLQNFNRFPQTLFSSTVWVVELRYFGRL